MTAAEVVLLVAVLAAGLLPARVAWRSGRRRPAVALALLAVAVSLGVAGAQVERRRASVPEAEIALRPVQTPERDYVGSDRCRSCHPREYATWHASFHRTMTQVATKGSVLGDFRDVELERAGRRYRLRESDDGFVVSVDPPHFPDADGRPPWEWPVVMTTGSHHEQVAWLASDGRRKLQMLPFMWLIPEQRWVPFESAVLHGSPVDGEVGGRPLWNVSCILCHTTQGQPRVRAAPDLDTKAMEFGISCEACHGPAQEHVTANRAPLRRYALHLAGSDDETIVNPAKLDHQRSSQVCGRCHGLSAFLEQQEAESAGEWGHPFRPGQDLNDLTVPIRAHDDRPPVQIRRILEYEPDYLDKRFWSDGMVRVSGREYNGMLESPCFQRGEMACVSCHRLHADGDDARPLEAWRDDQLARGMRGDAACLQCHPALAAQPEAHTHHAPATTGSGCQDCHMPYTTYGLLKTMRSHTISSPSAQETLETGRPNACSQCHLDRPLAWTAQYLQRWYGIAPPALDEEQRNVAAGALWLLRGDAGQRALAAWSMGWAPARETAGDAWMIPYLADALEDPYGAVQLVAARALLARAAFADLDLRVGLDAASSHAAREQVLARWRGLDASASTDRPALLFAPDGRRRPDVLERLRAQRADRVVDLLE